MGAICLAIVRASAQGHALAHPVCRATAAPPTGPGPALDRATLGAIINEEAARQAPPSVEIVNAFLGEMAQQACGDALRASRDLEQALQSPQERLELTGVGGKVVMEKSIV